MQKLNIPVVRWSDVTDELNLTNKEYERLVENYIECFALDVWLMTMEKPYDGFEADYSPEVGKLIKFLWDEFPESDTIVVLP